MYAKLVVYDVLGREVAVLVDGIEDAGYKTVYFSIKGGKANNLSSGIYFYKLIAGKFVQVKKIVITR